MSIRKASSSWLNTAVHKQSVDLAAIRRMDALWSSLVRQLGG